MDIFQNFLCILWLAILLLTCSWKFEVSPFYLNNEKFIGINTYHRVHSQEHLLNSICQWSKHWIIELFFSFSLLEKNKQVISLSHQFLTLDYACFHFVNLFYFQVKEYSGNCWVFSLHTGQVTVSKINSLNCCRFQIIFISLWFLLEYE